MTTLVEPQGALAAKAPARVKKVVVLGSSALKIGEAGEFDYSGSQAIKALAEEGIETVLINPNIATIQTSEGLADSVYFLPIEPGFVERVLEKERPDGLLLSFGGQTALNCGVALHDSGVLERLGIRVLGTPVDTIKTTEDRDLFVRSLDEIGVHTPRSRAASRVDEAIEFAHEIGYPVMLRIAFALGGLGSGPCFDEDELKDRAGRALAHTGQVLVEEYLAGWKEVEYEVVRDRFDNCLTVCNMENFDPLGIHTGESIVVAPSQTLDNHEYHMLREIAVRTVRHLGVVGECNIQYALDPSSRAYRVIEVNARLSRSSALASKATGYPLAFVASKLALGYGLDELPNAVTRKTSAFFEPALDYCVVKMPRWDLKKFRRVSQRIGSSMKSVGEVMAIGRSFEEAFQKAIRMLDIGARGLVANGTDFEFGDLEEELTQPTDQRVFAVVEAMRQGWSVDRVHELSRIDRWFLERIRHVLDLEGALKVYGSNDEIPPEALLEAKRAGYSDKQVAVLTDRSFEDVWEAREQHGIKPSVRQIDTLAAEFPAKTNYLYLTYHGDDDDIAPDPSGEHDKGTVLILGSGTYRIGCSVEFDWCCVNAARTLRKLGYKTALVNYNPETVSTDYDESDFLLFDEISHESVREIYERLDASGVIVSMGGQIPNNLALKLHDSGLRILGTSADSIDSAENRHKFSSLLDDLKIDQPDWAELNTIEEAKRFARDVGYPVLIRPSYVLSGAAMAVATNDGELETYLDRAALVTPDYPTVISKFLVNAKELECDAVAKDGELIVYAISEHVENAGVHSGDATLVFPAQRTYLETMRRIRKITREVAKRLKINGPFNIQFIAKENDVKVIECNLRASRSFPFVSKVIKHNFIDAATRAIVGEPVSKPEKGAFDLNYVGVKAPQFSFTRLEGADPLLGVEMASTGEVGCIGDDFNEAFLKALVSVGFKLPVKSVLVSAGPIESKAELLAPLRTLRRKGVTLYGTDKTASFLQDNDIDVQRVEWPLETDGASATTLIQEGGVDLVINIPSSEQEREITNGYRIRRAAVDYAVPLITNRQAATRFIDALVRGAESGLQVKAWDEY
ncbi:MAG: carbamoyl-phosphate synthase (glutamine-hydrolyzing) large subunit [Planctomycetota bacterium]